MFKNILVPTDLTEKSEKAFDIAVSIALNYKSDISLLHVIESIDGVEDSEFNAFYDKLTNRAYKTLEKMASRYQEKDITINKDVILGKRVAEIIHFANEREIDLIILSSHKIEDFSSGEGWATISYKVGILATCPVMMVK
ncbi:MAG: universal stress protein [Deltaproteobacteria bacterium]|nr:universal stress protein [Deltaproteobacteria bacterium]